MERWGGGGWGDDEGAGGMKGLGDRKKMGRAVRTNKVKTYLCVCVAEKEGGDGLHRG